MIQVILLLFIFYGASQVVLVVKNMPASARDLRDAASISGSGRFSWRREWHHFSILAWRIHGQRSLAGYSLGGVAKSQIQLKQLSAHAHTG